MKIKSSFIRLKSFRSFLSVFIILLSFVALSTRVHASSLAEGFSSNSSFTPGMLVSLLADKTDNLELATIGNSNSLFGVIESSGQGLVRFNHSGTNVSVATSGVAAVFVSDANGQIKKGDYIGPSWIDGIGMKVLEGDQHKTIGVALEDFDLASTKEFTDIKTANGSKTVKVGSLAVHLDSPPSKQLFSNESGVSGFTAKLVGRQVSVTRIVVGSLVFFVSVLVASLFIRSSIKNSFISIGRNPMASRQIYKSLLQVSLISMVVILLGTAAAYAVVVA